MVKKYVKGSDVQLSKNFHLREFDCHCNRTDCIVTYVSTELVQALELLRVEAGPITINDAYRCLFHNVIVGGKEHSQHLLGKAADIKSAFGPVVTAALAEEVPAFRDGGIGRYRTFTHVDVRATRARWQG